MKPAAFAYEAPRTRDAALALLAEHGEDGKILAGGQSLVPTMNFRLAQPNDADRHQSPARLATIARAGAELRIGALSRHARFERPVTDGPLGKLLPEVARHIAHTPIRTRGTFGGKPGACRPGVGMVRDRALALNARMIAESTTGTRAIPAADFFKSIFTTALRPDELLTEIRLPQLDETWRCGFAEYSRTRRRLRPGDGGGRAAARPGRGPRGLDRARRRSARRRWPPSAPRGS
ncbi:MAG: FAD binding domain-containing protein [Pseudomonadota bacterium]